MVAKINATGLGLRVPEAEIRNFIHFFKNEFTGLLMPDVEKEFSEYISKRHEKDLLEVNIGHTQEQSVSDQKMRQSINFLKEFVF